MSQEVNVPGIGTLSFPDGMTQQQMAAAIQKNYPSIHASKQSSPSVSASKPDDGLFAHGIKGYLSGVGQRAEGAAAGALGELQKTNDAIENLALRLHLPAAELTERLKDIPAVHQHLQDINNWIKTSQQKAPEAASVGKEIAQTGEMIGGGELGGAIARPILEGAEGLADSTALAKPIAFTKPLVQQAAEGAAGFAAPTPDKGKTRAGNALTGAITGAAVGTSMKPISAVARKGIQKLAQSRLSEAEDELPLAVKLARQYGVKITPQEAGGKSHLLNTMESVGGPPHLAANLSKFNQAIFDNLAREDAEIPRGVPLTEESIKKLNKEGPGQAYRDVEGVGNFKTDDEWKQDVMNIAPVPKNMPPDKQPAIFRMKKAYSELKSMNSREAIQRIQSLREDAQRNISRGGADEVKLGQAQKKLADAIENQLDRALSKMPGKEDLLSKYRAARKLFAKRFDLQDALVNRHVNLQKLAKSTNRGQFTGKMKDLATMADEFKSVTQVPEKISEASESSSRQDVRYILAKALSSPVTLAAGAAGGAAAMGGGMSAVVTAGTIAALARPGLRAFLKSDVGQRWIESSATRAEKLSKIARLAKLSTEHPNITANAVKAAIFPAATSSNKPSNTLASVPTGGM